MGRSKARDPRPATPWDKAYASGEYRREWDYRHASQELVGFIASIGLPRAAVVLDVGCGAGREAIFLARCGYFVIGVDVSRAAIAIARRRARAARVDVQWLVGSALALPVRRSAVDCVTDRGCFHIVPRKDRPQFGREIARVLTPGGYLLLRGSAATSPGFGGVSAAGVDRAFPRTHFSRGPVLPISLVADSGTLRANLVVARRR